MYFNGITTSCSGKLTDLFLGIGLFSLLSVVCVIFAMKYDKNLLYVLATLSIIGTLCCIGGQLYYLFDYTINALCKQQNPNYWKATIGYAYVVFLIAIVCMVLSLSYDFKTPTRHTETLLRSYFCIYLQPYFHLRLSFR